MFFVIAFLIMLSTYVGVNQKIQDKSKQGYFVVFAIVLILVLVFTFVLK